MINFPYSFAAYVPISAADSVVFVITFGFSYSYY